MTYTAKTVEGTEIDLGKPVSVRINREEDAPADDLIAVFALEKEFPELCDICVTAEDGNAVFKGIADEQLLQYTARGATLVIKARSRAAVLLDNEALPQTYYMPSMPVIFQRHIQPYGFEKFEGSDKAFSSKLQITKGMSEWQVLAQFCKEFLGTVPRVTVQGVVDVSGQASSKTAVFSNEGGISYISLKENIRRHQLLSEVLVRSAKSGGYNTRVTDRQAIKDKVLRRRYLNAADDARTPVGCGEHMLKDARHRAYEITLVCPKETVPEIGCQVCLRDRILGTVNGLTVAASNYILDDDGQRWEITLRKS